MSAAPQGLPTVLLPVEHNGELYVLESLDPNIYPLAPHFAYEAFRWEMAMKAETTPDRLT